MKNYSIAKSRRIRSTPYTSRIEKQGVTAPISCSQVPDGLTQISE